jgi:thymidylate synthase (FAD)
MPEKRLDRAVEENAEIRPTKRSVAPGLETYINRTIPILDHGFIRVVDYMGDDSSIVQAARVSYGRGTKTKSEDAALISYLLRHRHTTPFEMCEIKLYVKLPIFVARQWVRHRTASINEYSARYKPDMPISGIRLSDQLHREAHGGGAMCTRPGPRILCSQNGRYGCSESGE